MGSLHSNMHVNARVPKSHAFNMGRIYCVLGSQQEEDPEHIGHHRSFSTTFVEHPRDWCQMTNRTNPENQESNRCESIYVLCMRVFLLPSRCHPNHVACTSESIALARYEDLLDALVVKQPRLRDHRVTRRYSVEHESSKPRLPMLSSMYESGMRTKECHLQSLMQNQHENGEIC